MKKKKGLIVFLLLILTFQIFSQDNGWRFLNHESGGYVTAIIPIKYLPGQQPSSINSQVLYARTDIGGIYRSTDNGTRWNFNSCYYRTLNRNYAEVTGSDFHIQGVASRFSHRDASGTEYDVVVVTTGHYFEDHNKPEVNFRSIWRSDNNGNTGTFVEGIINTPQGIWFKGNNFRAKIGGENIIYDPNNINGLFSVMYAGGWYPNISQGVAKPCYLYKSIDDGRNWRNDISGVQTFPSTTHQNDTDPEGIICIYIKPGDNQKIFVGTTHRIVYTLNGGSSWDWKYVTGVTRPHVNRIIFKTSGGVTTVFFTYGTYNSAGNPVTGIGRLSSDNAYNYVSMNIPAVSDLLSGLTFGAGDENIIFASSVGGTVLRSTNNGSNWVNIGHLKYLEGGYNQNFIPAHSTEYWRSPHSPNDNNIYHGTSQLVFNPNPGWGSQWYMAGGAGARKTPENGVQNNNLQNSRWLYTVEGQSMPVVYDVVFKNLRLPNNSLKTALYMPMSDWTMSWEYQDSITPNGGDWLIPRPFKYDRHRTIACNYDTRISNVTRIVFHPLSETMEPNYRNLSYCLGGSIYNLSFCAGEGNRRARLYRRKDVDGTGNNIIFEPPPPGDPIYNTDNRAFVDALMYQTPGDANRIIALVGQSEGQVPPNGSTLGVFYSDNGGDTWTQGTFNTEDGSFDAYSGSKLPALTSEAISGSLGDLFAGHFSLSHFGGSRLLLWLEEGIGSHFTGGMFISLNNGATWNRLQPNANNNSYQPPCSYFGPGSLKYVSGNEIILAVRTGTAPQSGLFRGIINTSVNPPTATWQAIGNFISAEHVDIVNGKWAVWGRRTGDKENQIYKSMDNGVTWSRIPQGHPLPLFARINSLRIRPFDGSLWIATSGQGVWIYTAFTASEHISSY